MKYSFLALACGLSLTTFAQSEVLFSIDGENVTAEEFSYVYNKNNDIGRDIDPKTPREYLDLYINFKLKVHEAEELGMDTTVKFTREFNTYKEQLARPYMTLKDVNEEIVQEAYQHMLWDVRARHIMMDLSPEALPADTLKVYNDLLNIREQILKGQRSFESAAKVVSTDTYSAQRGGDLGWFTAFNMVYPFEKKVYALEPGEISLPVRTEYGYHLIETTDKRAARGTIDVAHILAFIPENATEEEKAAAERKINEIYAKLLKGEDFATLARQHSDDKTTAQQGGGLPTFGMREMLPEFEEASFALENDGEISQPVKTKIGWHIIKLIHKNGIQDYEHLKPELIQKIGRDSRSNIGANQFLQKLKTEYDFKENESNLMKVLNSIGEDFSEGDWDADQFSRSSKVVYSFADQEITQAELAAHLDMIQQRHRSSNDNKARAYGICRDFANNELLEYEKSQLAVKYPQYAFLVSEYREGILLFDLTQENIWSVSTSDSAGLANFYASNVNKYVVGPRYHVLRVSASTEKVAEDVLEDLEDGMKGAEIIAKYNTRSELTVRVDTLKIVEGENTELDDKFKGKMGVYGEMMKDGRFVSYNVFEILPEGPRALEEIKGFVISDYQSFLEANWVRQLRAKYEVKVNEDVMSKLEEQL